jgi:competence protein ComEC
MQKARRNTSIALSAAMATLALLAVLLVPAGCDKPYHDPPGPTPINIHTEAIDMTVSVIDVGQGDSILIMSEGETLLVDAGENGAEVVSYLEKQKIAEIDYLVATHADRDHIGGMVEVLNKFDVEHDVIAPELASGTETYKDFAAAVNREPGVSLTTPAVGTSYELGDATIVVIANGTGEIKTNESSIVLKVICGGKSILLTGDIPASVERKLIASGQPLDSDVLKVAHHGSNGSSTTAFLAAVSPEIAVISVGATNSYGHPRQEVLDRLKEAQATVYRTDEGGTVRLLFSDGAITQKAA